MQCRRMAEPPERIRAWGGLTARQQPACRALKLNFMQVMLYLHASSYSCCAATFAGNSMN